MRSLPVADENDMGPLGSKRYEKTGERLLGTERFERSKNAAELPAEMRVHFLIINSKKLLLNS